MLFEWRLSALRRTLTAAIAMIVVSMNLLRKRDVILSDSANGLGYK
jgi:hypothetical protein